MNFDPILYIGVNVLNVWDSKIIHIGDIISKNKEVQ